MPGRPLFFASAITLGGVARPVLVESHMGRPTKIEGNPEHPASLGATDILTQAAVLGLYDPDRAQTVTYRGEVRPWSAFQSAIQSALAAQKATRGRGSPDSDRARSPRRRSSELLATILQRLPASALASIRSGRRRWRTPGLASGDGLGQPGRLPPRQGRRRRLARRRFPRSRARRWFATRGTSPTAAASPTTRSR